MKDVGELLTRSREDKGISLQQAQAETKIRGRYLEALEQGDLEAFPGEVYFKGFLRTYADYLGLDGWALVAEYNKRRATEQEEESERSRGRRKKAAKKRPRRRPPLKESPSGVYIALFVVALLAALALFLHLTGGIQLTAPSEPPAEAPAAGEPAADGSPSDEGADDGTAAPEPEPEPRPTVTLLQETDGEVIYQVTAARIEVQVRADRPCWVRVVADGRVVGEETLTAGDMRVYEGDEAVRLRAGYPKGLQVTLNGEDLGEAGSENPRNLEFRAAPGGSGP